MSFQRAGQDLEDYRRAQRERERQDRRDDGNVGALGRRPGQDPGGAR